MRNKGHLGAEESDESSSQTEADDKDVDCGEITGYSYNQ